MLNFQKTGKTLYYRDAQLKSLKGAGYKSNYCDVNTGDEYWMSGPKKNGQDTLYPDKIYIDADIREEYWRDIRGIDADTSVIRSEGKHAGWRTLQFTKKKA